MDIQMSHPRLDTMINRLLQKRSQWDWNEFESFKSEIEQLCLACSAIFLKESSLLRLKAPIKIAGRFHGQFKTLMSVFEHDGFPPYSNYLFLGNYGDRDGIFFETVLLLLAFKIKYPKNLFLLRGSFDGGRPARTWPVGCLSGIDECEMRQYMLLDIINGCLRCLPIAALVNDKIICTYGGFSRRLRNLDQIRHIRRPLHVPDSGLLRDLLGSDPETAKKATHDANNFDAEEVQGLLKKHGLRLICCGYDQVVMSGYKVFDEQRIVFICSAHRSVEYKYHNNLDKVGAMMSVDANLMYSFYTLKPDHRRWGITFMGGTNQPESLPRVDFTYESAMDKCGEESGEWDPPLKEGSVTSTSQSGSSPGDAPSTSKLATKYRGIFTGFKLTNWTSKANSGNSASTSEPESSQGVNHPVIKSATNHRCASPDLVKRAERVTFVSGTPTTARTNKYRSDSPELKIVRNHGSVGGAESESEPRTFPPDFDPANMYRSKSPGVKRFIGARV